MDLQTGQIFRRAIDNALIVVVLQIGSIVYGSLMDPGHSTRSEELAKKETRRDTLYLLKREYPIFEAEMVVVPCYLVRFLGLQDSFSENHALVGTLNEKDIATLKATVKACDAVPLNVRNAL